MKHPRIHNDKHLDFIRSLVCLCCGDNTSIEAAHVRYSDSRVAKFNPGVAAKPDDMWTLPLCSACHRLQHSRGEREFWKAQGIDPIFYALAFYAVSGDHDRAIRIINASQSMNILAAG